jgi:acetyl esterase/lipase
LSLLPALLVLSSLLGSPPEEIPLWPKGAPGSEGQAAAETTVPSTDGVRRIATIHNPSISVHLPSREKATGAAVIVLPGGGHRYLSIDNEGHAVAGWLSERGIAAFVLKYRLARETGSSYTIEGHAVPDAQRALRLVRSRAKEWGIDPERVGILGFSAGGQLATYAATRFDSGKPDADDPVQRESSRPAFQALLYPGSTGADTLVPKDAPPAFLCVASDDREPSRTAVSLFQKLRDAGVSAELHVYAKGGHGFGMRDRPVPITGWPLRFHEWMADQGFLTGGTAKP